MTSLVVALLPARFGRRRLEWAPARGKAQAWLAQRAESYDARALL